MADYKKLESSSKLSKYKVVFQNWRRRNPHNNELEYISKVFAPFSNFDTTVGKSPDWYVAYNGVKHNREDNLENANLENCLNAVGAILILLYSQFGSCCIETYGSSGPMWQTFDAYDNNFDADVIFAVVPPQLSDWTTDELYDFKWPDIESDVEPFDKFPF